MADDSKARHIINPSFQVNVPTTIEGSETNEQSRLLLETKQFTQMVSNTDSSIDTARRASYIDNAIVSDLLHPVMSYPARFSLREQSREPDHAIQ